MKDFLKTFTLGFATLVLVGSVIFLGWLILAPVLTFKMLLTGLIIVYSIFMIYLFGLGIKEIIEIMIGK